jgi:cbb3-type cytochrome oxidase maturation protein
VTILVVLIPLGLLMLIVAIVAFVWAVSNGQYDDLEGEGTRILFEDETNRPLGRMPQDPSKGDA